MFTNTTADHSEKGRKIAMVSDVIKYSIHCFLVLSQAEGRSHRGKWHSSFFYDDKKEEIEWTVLLLRRK